MKVRIRDVEGSDTQLRVAFECECGQGVGLWSGSPPLAGDVRFVELEVEPAVAVENELTKTDAPQGLRLEADLQVLVGEITKVTEDGYARLDLGCGGVDLSIIGLLPVLHGRYRLLVRELRVFDCSY